MSVPLHDLAEAQHLHFEAVQEATKTANLLERAPWDEDEKRVLRAQIEGANQRAEELARRIRGLEALAAGPATTSTQRCTYCRGEAADSRGECIGCGASEWETAA